MDKSDQVNNTGDNEDERVVMDGGSGSHEDDRDYGGDGGEDDRDVIDAGDGRDVIDGDGDGGGEDDRYATDSSDDEYKRLFDLSPHVVVDEDGVIINVYDVKLRSYKVKVNLESSVKSLQTFMANNCRFPPDEPRIYKGIVLKGHRTLQSYGVKADHDIYMHDCIYFRRVDHRSGF
ncbi:hypothetical protein Dsin_026797 [Dipteronia sinensis]|uniref:Ubiquitin-like domain-containing protein n=1 Tax=Dipteronia sinensis TaxID=43782 RepID=A0AAD9ZYC1_9ROSI|nr:hypothetical protein Dsin_026797 [Dipteronia sinensis]